MNENKSVLTIPHDFEAEEAVLGAIILDNKMIFEAMSILTPNSFHDENHRHIYRAMLELVDSNQPIDEILLGDQLKEFGKLEDIGGYACLAELVDCVPSSGNIVYYSRIVQEHAIARDIITTASDLSRKGRDTTVSIKQLLEEADEKFRSIRENALTKDHVLIRDAVLKAFATLEELSENKSEITGIPTGFLDIDRITSGLKPSDLIIIAARPSQGKTAIALNIATYVAIKNKSKGAVLIFTFEMSTEQLVFRMLAAESRIDSKKLQTGNLEQEDWDKLAKATDRLLGAPIYIIDKVLTINEVRAISRTIDQQHEGGVSLIVMDYLQLMESSVKGSREQEVSEMSRGSKQLAKDLNVPVIALSQLNRALENRTDKRPKLPDLRESGSIEQDADIIMFIYRDEVYYEDSEKKGIAEIIIAKHRNGPIGMVELVFTGKYTKFSSMSKINPPSHIK
jgi:replicative DNA helicase